MCYTTNHSFLHPDRNALRHKMPSTHSLPSDIPHAGIDQRIANFKQYIDLQNDQITDLQHFIDSYANPDNVQKILDKKVNRIDELEILIGKLYDDRQQGVDAIEELHNDVDSLLTELERNRREIERITEELDRNKRELESEIGRNKSELERNRSELERNMADLERNRSELERNRAELERNKREQEKDTSEILKLREDAAAKQQRIVDLERYVARLEGIAAATEAEGRGLPGRWAVNFLLGSRF